MGHTYSQILIHAVFSTREREPTIHESFRSRLWQYMAGIAKQEFGHAVRIGGIADHLHGLIKLKTDVSLAHAMNRWKSLSSGWVNQTFEPRVKFQWQAGYGAFSVSQSAAERVIHYIDHQAEHHHKMSFQEELISLLERHGIEYDPKTIWD